MTPSSRRAGRWATIFFGTGSVGAATDIALLATRTALSWVFIYYGAAKLFGSFGGAGPHGIHDSTLFFSNTAHLHPAEFFAILAGLIEFVGGIAVALGLCTRLAGLALFGDMVTAMVTVTWATGINSTSSPPGYQLNIALSVLALVIALIGPGRLSIDAYIRRRLGLGTVDKAPAALPVTRKHRVHDPRVH
jgi:putative oxidoreductase